MLTIDGLDVGLNRIKRKHDIRSKYIEVFCNLQRRDAKLGGISPEEFERKFHKMIKAA